MVYIYYTSFDSELPDDKFKEYMSLIPEILREKNKKYIRWQDKHAHLFGLLLLIRGLQDYGLDHETLKLIRYNKFSRPYINDSFDFNISHSGNYVICAIGDNITIGVDIEKIRTVDLRDFKQVMSVDQWKDIYGAKEPLKKFFTYWAIKESVIKADSRGLSLPLQNIDILGNRVVCESNIWYLSKLSINSKFCSFLATSKKNVKINLIEEDFIYGN